MAIVQGTNNSETLNKADGVTEFADTIYGQGGNDTIFGFGGNDLIIGGAGGDDIDGGEGTDTAFYTDSFEGVSVSLATGIGNNGTAEEDTLTSIENLYGSAYDDTLAGNNSSNALSGMAGSDLLKGGGGADTLSGGSGDDTLLGGSGADTIYGNDGIDTLSYAGSSAAVSILLLTGHASGGHAEGDVYSGIENVIGSSCGDELHGNEAANALAGGDGNDTLKGFGGDDDLDGGEHDDVLHGMGGNDEMNGDGGNDILYGGEGDDDLLGLGGNDTLYGGSGDDFIPGGFGTDTMYGGTGNDRFAANELTDVVIEAIGEGAFDLVYTTLYTYALAAGSEIEALEPVFDYLTHPLHFTGNEFDNTITTNAGDNILDGAGGSDQLIGLAGNDTYFVNNTYDSVTELGGEGNDEVRASESWTLTAGADVETLRTINDAGTAALDLTGNATGNTVIGNNGNNVLNGGDGEDWLTGLAGQDAFLFDTPLDEDINVDTITDFNVADDTIRLDQDIFSSNLGLGNISSGELVIGSAAQDANDRIIYDSTTGALSYDSDGVGGAAATQFAQLSPGLALTYLDFLVV